MFEFPAFLDRLPEFDLGLPGFRGRLLQGATQQAALMSFDQEVVVPEHSHGEQWELVVAGEVVLTAGGATRTYRVGESFHIPAGALHSAVVKAGYRSVAFFAQPDRYRAL
ncbi:MAG TPA: cupin domain-containing protein [Candidatus Krumholzibacteria bacterium]|nr:cupin domain-containing protein [Candidatus Krumholzibacteria bacterium]HPD72279.1 cupin domain-containing protein [Candidatus Krumholzibacteria bacterium]HRY40789.1 cupin domain-containing protein [Candidatus Krumholzibacteria bacterium]